MPSATTTIPTPSSTLPVTESSLPPALRQTTIPVELPETGTSDLLVAWAALLFAVGGSMVLAVRR
ncbi:MAG: LPXTG cell wall anchor domain-containing protein [Dermatophilaceae bacterium]